MHQPQFMSMASGDELEAREQIDRPEVAARCAHLWIDPSRGEKSSPCDR
jgi:hypothetical protein